MILLYEPDTGLHSRIVDTLHDAAIEVRPVEELEQLKNALDAKRPELIVLAWTLDASSLLDLCRDMKNDPTLSSIPILLISERVQEHDAVAAFAAGVDDFVRKPLSTAELVARVIAHLRRRGGERSAEMLRSGDLSVDLARKRVMIGSRHVHASPVEYDLLVTLMGSPGRIFSREQLLELIWINKSIKTVRTVDVQLNRLRKLIAVDGRNPIVTVRGLGFKFDEDFDR